jgi:hypothetical protein
MPFKAWCRWCRYRITWNERARQWRAASIKIVHGRPAVCALAPYYVHDPDPERP